MNDIDLEQLVTVLPASAGTEMRWAHLDSVMLRDAAAYVRSHVNRDELQIITHHDGQIIRADAFPALFAAVDASGAAS